MTTDSNPEAAESKPFPGHSGPDCESIGKVVLNTADSIEVMEAIVVDGAELELGVITD